MQLQKIENKIYEFTFSKETSKEDLEKLVVSFQEFEDRNEKINYLARFQNFPSLESMLSISGLVNLKLKGFRVINKYAIVADKAWMKYLMPVANFFTPSFPIKAFTVDQGDEAIKWLTEAEV